MISFNYETDFELENEAQYEDWISRIIESEGFDEGEINYIFCDDDYLLKVNQDYLDHDYYTDIITFDYVKGKIISGDIFVSLPRILDNASTLSQDFESEFRRVLAHGLLHLCGYKDKTVEEESTMRQKEDFYINRYLNF